MNQLKRRAEALLEKLNVNNRPIVVSLVLSGLGENDKPLVQRILVGDPPPGYTVESYLKAFVAGTLHQGQRKALKGRVKRKTSKTRRTR